MSPYLDNPSYARRVVDLHFDYDDVPAMLDLSGPPCHDDNTDCSLLQKNGVDKLMNDTDRNCILKILDISNALFILIYFNMKLFYLRIFLI